MYSSSVPQYDGMSPEQEAAFRTALAEGPKRSVCCTGCGFLFEIGGVALLAIGILGLTAVLPMATGLAVTMIVIGSIIFSMGMCGCCCAANTAAPDNPDEAPDPSSQ